MNGYQKNALKRYKNKIEYIYPILCCMVAGNITNKQAASIAGVNYEHFRSAMRIPDNGTITFFENVLEALENYLGELNK
ncbi:hypothetical protein [Klebsiella variicola]|uniref:hypothetical protein n=1 Tax=Klebsiella variicola TaxID=244366 RepID=UPI003D0882A1